MNHDYSPERAILDTAATTLHLCFCYGCGVLRQRWSSKRIGATREVLSYTTAPLRDGEKISVPFASSDEPACAPSVERSTAKTLERERRVAEQAHWNGYIGVPLERDEWRNLSGLVGLLHVSKYDAPASVAKPYGPFPSTWRTWCRLPLVGVSWFTRGLIEEPSAFERGDAICVACLEALPRSARPM